MPSTTRPASLCAPSSSSRRRRAVWLCVPFFPFCGLSLVFAFCVAVTKFIVPSSFVSLISLSMHPFQFTCSSPSVRTPFCMLTACLALFLHARPCEVIAFMSLSVPLLRCTRRFASSHACFCFPFLRSSSDSVSSLLLPFPVPLLCSSHRFACSLFVFLSFFLPSLLAVPFCASLFAVDAFSP